MEIDVIDESSVVSAFYVQGNWNQEKWDGILKFMQ